MSWTYLQVIGGGKERNIDPPSVLADETRWSAVSLHIRPFDCKAWSVSRHCRIFDRNDLVEVTFHHPCAICPLIQSSTKKGRVELFANGRILWALHVGVVDATARIVIITCVLSNVSYLCPACRVVSRQLHQTSGTKIESAMFIARMGDSLDSKRNTVICSSPIASSYGMFMLRLSYVLHWLDRYRFGGTVSVIAPSAVIVGGMYAVGEN